MTAVTRSSGCTWRPSAAASGGRVSDDAATDRLVNRSRWCYGFTWRWPNLARGPGKEADHVKEAAKEVMRRAGFNLLVVCGFAFDPARGRPPASSRLRLWLGDGRRGAQLGRLGVLFARMIPNPAMGGDLLKRRMPAATHGWVRGARNPGLSCGPDGEVPPWRTATLLAGSPCDPRDVRVTTCLNQLGQRAHGRGQGRGDLLPMTRANNGDRGPVILTPWVKGLPFPAGSMRWVKVRQTSGNRLTSVNPTSGVTSVKVKRAPLCRALRAPERPPSRRSVGGCIAQRR